MQNSTCPHREHNSIKGFLISCALLLFFCPGNNAGLYAQLCPPNIDFESSTFDRWTCHTGSVAAVSGQNIISLTPSGSAIADRHTMMSANPGDGLDPFGGFPVNCPNGSGHSIKLGNTSGGGEAEGISYTFTIPANENAYTLIYNYAVVFQDPNHQENEQPRMEIEITNVTDNTVISCASFTFRPYGTTLPGFKVSPNPGSNTPVLYKDWTPVSINLSGNAGKTIRLFFKTADCTFRRHFGYAYIDVNSECSGTFVGATYCRDDTAINVSGPYGYQGYTWYNSNLSQVLGNQQVLTLSPPPAAGTVVAVKLVPYAGYGCPQTLFAQLIDTLTVVSNAGKDVLSCNRTPVQVGAPPKPGLVYRWRPTAGLSNPNIANPLASPDSTTTYVLTTNHDGGGCITTDTVVVKASIINNTIQLAGVADYCLGRGDSAVLQVAAADSIQWYRDNVAIPGARQQRYKVLTSGAYYATLQNSDGCSISTPVQQVNIASIPASGFVPPDNANQCLVGNKFGFINTSTNSIGQMEYTWLMGDGSRQTSRDINYSYPRAGVYKVKLIVSSNKVCADSTDFTVQVYPNAIADFSLRPVCVDLPAQPVNNTSDTLGSPVQYLWNLGNGQTSTLRTPPAQVFKLPGNYSISLSVNTPQCPTPLHTVRQTLVVERPRNGIRYPDKYAVINLPLPLESRNFGDSILWTPGISLNTRTSDRPMFTGANDQAYAIAIKTAAGCTTVDSLQVKTVKQVEMYVPTAFTPNNDGRNDFLHPVLMGIVQVRYFRVFNRWGELVYQMHSDRPGWDGTVKGVPQQSQTVVWAAEGIGVDGKTYTRKGTSVLIR
ncbi:T9SS type B sorting domain-containing protein [Segetibacter sp. 3557_3]|uniref:PKD domain-containing protein n=1 Tax=Segetibacter sp. 3557_3 TaxID=2547429 RepID=UPI0010591C1A|nr:PKD domain-containing protein [Segetibacter sp. 3557_3]TDH24228.1 T9SS type B sorting domain-containing protein [Segetibacter sp. 3557_3]